MNHEHLKWQSSNHSFCLPGVANSLRWIQEWLGKVPSSSLRASGYRVWRWIFFHGERAPASHLTCACRTCPTHSSLSRKTTVSQGAHSGERGHTAGASHSWNGTIFSIQKATLRTNICLVIEGPECDNLVYEKMGRWRPRTPVTLDFCH